MIERQDEHRAAAIQCVAELRTLLDTLDAEVVGGAGRRDVRWTVSQIRHHLRVLEDATMRDGRWPGHSPASTPRNAPWLHVASGDTDSGCSHAHCDWIKDEERYDCEVPRDER